MQLDLHVLCILEATGSNTSPKNDFTDKNRAAQILQKCWRLLKILPPNIVGYILQNPVARDLRAPLPVYRFRGVPQSLHTHMPKIIPN